MRPRISIRGSVRPSVRPSVGPSVRRSVRNAFVKSGEMKHLRRKKYGETHLICLICPPASLWHDMSVGRSVRQNKCLFFFIYISFYPKDASLASGPCLYSMIILSCNIRIQYISAPWHTSNFYNSLFWRYFHCIYVITFWKNLFKFLWYHFRAVWRYSQIRICRS